MSKPLLTCRQMAERLNSLPKKLRLGRPLSKHQVLRIVKRLALRPSHLITAPFTGTGGATMLFTEADERRVLAELKKYPRWSRARPTQPVKGITTAQA